MSTSLLKETGCLVCRSVEKRPLFVKEGKSFVRCPGCGLIYQDPPPDPAEERTFFSKGYYENFGALNESILQARLSIYRDALGRFQPFRRTGRLLDVGSGYGGFLKMAQEAGWEPWGIEPSEGASEAAREIPGLRVLSQEAEAADLPKNYFDVITLWNVLDYFLDPRGALEKVRHWLRPGGILFIRTPNASFHLLAHRFHVLFHPCLKRFGWEKDASAFHRANFHAKSLRKLLEQAGFEAPQIQNGPPTGGDAYQIFSRPNFLPGVKYLLYEIARLMEFLTGGRRLAGSNLTAFSSKSQRVEKAPRPVGQRRIFLKALILHTLAVLGYLLGLPLWFKLLGKGREIRVLRYHGVDEFQENDLTVRESQFKRQLEFLKSHYSPLSLGEAVECLEREALPSRPSVALTFDDGYQDNYRVVFPLLREKEVPATVFFLTGGKGPLAEQDRLLHWNEVRAMAESGVVEFGSHGERHSRLSSLPRERAEAEIRASKEKIEAEISRSVSFFSYPYGTAVDFNSEVQSAVRRAGYRAAFSAVFGTNSARTDRFALKRIGIEASDSLFTLRAKLNGALGLLVIFDRPFVRRLVRWFDGAVLRRSSANLQKESPLLLISVDFPPHTDGVSTISREVCRRTAERGKKIIAIGPSDRGDRDFDARQSYRVFRVPGYEWGYLRFLPLLVMTPWVVIRTGVRKIFAMNIAYGGVLSWMLSFFVPLEYVIFAYGYEFEKVRSVPLARWLYLSIYHRARKIVACSKLVKERLIRFGVMPEKIEVLYPAVDLDRFRPGEVSPAFLEKKGIAGKKILLTVGRLIERKGHDLVFRALPEILRVFPDVLYCIVGIGEQEDRLRELVRSLNLEGSVRFLGKIPDEELVEMYRASSVFVMPSREIEAGGHIEGFGIVYLEANACARPVIGGRSGGVIEAVREGETGLLADPSDPRELAEKIIYLLSHPQEAGALGGRGLEWVRQAFNWERYTEEAYRFLAGEPLA